MEDGKRELDPLADVALVGGYRGVSVSERQSHNGRGGQLTLLLDGDALILLTLLGLLLGLLRDDSLAFALALGRASSARLLGAGGKRGAAGVRGGALDGSRGVSVGGSAVELGVGEILDHSRDLHVMGLEEALEALGAVRRELGMRNED